jgi:hypothetical protein
MLLDLSVQCAALIAPYEYLGAPMFRGKAR